MSWEHILNIPVPCTRFPNGTVWLRKGNQANPLFFHRYLSFKWSKKKEAMRQYDGKRQGDLCRYGYRHLCNFSLAFGKATMDVAELHDNHTNMCGQEFWKWVVMRFVQLSLITISPIKTEMSYIFFLFFCDKNEVKNSISEINMNITFTNQKRKLYINVCISKFILTFRILGIQ